MVVPAALCCFQGKGTDSWRGGLSFPVRKEPKKVSRYDCLMCDGLEGFPKIFGRAALGKEPVVVACSDGELDQNGPEKNWSAIQM